MGGDGIARRSRLTGTKSLRDPAYKSNMSLHFKNMDKALGIFGDSVVARQPLSF